MVTRHSIKMGKRNFAFAVRGSPTVPWIRPWFIRVESDREPLMQMSSRLVIDHH